MTGKVGMKWAKTVAANWQPCFTCPLRECDDKSPKCAYRKALNEYQRVMRQHARKSKVQEPITEEMKAHYAVAYSELYGVDR